MDRVPRIKGTTQRLDTSHGTLQDQRSLRRRDKYEFLPKLLCRHRGSKCIYVKSVRKVEAQDVIQFFDDCQRIMLFLWFAPSLSRMHKRTLTHMFAVACVMKRTLSRMPIITSILSWTVTLCEREASLLVLFPEGVFLVGFPFSQRIPSWRAGRSRTLYFSHGSSLLLLIVFQSTLISSRALTFCCPLNAISTVFLWTCHWQCQRQAFQVVFHVNRNASDDFSVPRIGGPPSFEVWCRLGIHLSEQYLACTETAMASASLPVKFLTDCSWLTHGNWL